jgi:DNA-binding transcriptional MerR regulator
MMDQIPAIADVATPMPEIPDKLFFRIGEVSQIVGVEAYVLRYWESEFKGLSPRKSSSGQRMFRRRDVELLLQIKYLLYDRKFTIEGARMALQDLSRDKDKKDKARKLTALSQAELFPSASPLPGIRQELADILKMLL